MEIPGEKTRNRRVISGFFGLSRRGEDDDVERRERERVSAQVETRLKESLGLAGSAKK